MYVYFLHFYFFSCVRAFIPIHSVRDPINNKKNKGGIFAAFQNLINMKIILFLTYITILTYLLTNQIF